MPTGEWNQAAASTAGGALGGIIGIALGGINNRRQVKQQRRLNELEKEMTDYNMGKQLEMWEKTGYGAQMKQLKDAGLNAGLLYGMGGAGGQTSNVATGNGGGNAQTGGEATAGMGMGIASAMQLALLGAQKANIEADTAKKVAETQKTSGVDTQEGQARTEILLQGVDNAKMDYEVKRLDIAMKNIQNYEQQTSQEDRLEFIKFNALRAGEELKKILNENYVTSRTLPERIKIIQEEAIGAVLKNALTKEMTESQNVGQAVDQQKIKESVNQIMQNWDRMEQGNRDLQIRDVLKSFNTDLSNELFKQTADGIGDIMKMGMRQMNK